MAEFQREYQNATESIDFSDGLDGNFGAEDATIIAKNQLDSYMLNETPTNTDTSKIEKVTEQPVTKVDPKQETTKVDGKATEQTEETKQAKAGDSLKDWLSGGMQEEQKEDTSTEQSTTTQTDTTQQVDADDDNNFSILSKELTKLGIFTKDEDEEGNEIAFTTKDPKEFKSRWEKEKEKGANTKLYNFLNKFGDEYNQMFRDVFVKGANPQEYLSKYAKIESFKDLDLTQQSNQERIFTSYWKQAGLSDELTQKKLEKARDLGDLEDDAKTFHSMLVTREEKSLKDLADQAEQTNLIKQQREAAYHENVGKILQSKMTAGDFDGIPVSKKEAQETFNYLTEKPWKLESGELITEMQKDWLELDRPENHELKVKIALLLKNKGDLSKIQKKAISEKTDQLFGDLTNKKVQNTRKTTVKQPTSFFD